MLNVLCTDHVGIYVNFSKLALKLQGLKQVQTEDRSLWFINGLFYINENSCERFYLTDSEIMKQSFCHSFSLFYPPFCFPTSDSKPESLEAHKIKTAFFTHPTLTEIGRRLVSHYFLLTEEELAMWEEDPESFGNYASPDTQAEDKDISRPADCRVKTRSWSKIVRISQFYSSWSQQCLLGSRRYQNLLFIELL